MAKYIDQEALAADGWYLQRYISRDGYHCVQSMHILNVPAADAVEVRHARWEDCSNGWMCSACSHDSTYDTPYCPHCGAKMDLAGAVE